MTQQVLYTIGHSSQTVEEFLQMLEPEHIQVLVDVRSIPASKYAPQFNKMSLANFLERHQITYMYFGEEFGARRTDAWDVHRRVDFQKAINIIALRLFTS